MFLFLLILSKVVKFFGEKLNFIISVFFFFFKILVSVSVRVVFFILFFGLNIEII